MTYSLTSKERNNKSIAIVVQAVKLFEHEPGLTRAEYIASVLSEAGYSVDLITSKFQHWEKQHRKDKLDFSNKPYNVVMLDEPGYNKNIDLKRIKSHKILGDNLQKYLDTNGKKYSLIWCQIPPNNLARIAGEYAKKHNIHFIIDVNDLWPEAMKMALNIPIISDIVFGGFTRDAKRAYSCVSAIVGTSDEYANYPAKYIPDTFPRETVYVGNVLSVFDEAVKKNAAKVKKAENEFWVTYAGTLGKSYDLSTLIEAVGLAVRDIEKDSSNDKVIRCKILGDGPDKEKLISFAKEIQAPVDFLGYVEYDFLAAYLSKSDVLVNSLVKKAPQSIVSKVADYFAAGKPMINTGKSYEFTSMILQNQCGKNIEPEDAKKLSEQILYYYKHSDSVKIEGMHARVLAEEKFDRKNTYQKIIDLIDKFL